MWQASMQFRTICCVCACWFSSSHPTALPIYVTWVIPTVLYSTTTTYKYVHTYYSGTTFFTLVDRQLSLSSSCFTFCPYFPSFLPSFPFSNFQTLFSSSSSLPLFYEFPDLTDCCVFMSQLLVSDLVFLFLLFLFLKFVTFGTI